MRLLPILMAAGVATTAASAAAQDRSGYAEYQRGYSDWRSERSEAIPASTLAEPAEANARAAEEADGGPYVVTRYVDEERYARDMRTYYAERRALAQHRARQERAYAAAMRAWYAQVRDCDHGDRDACEAPSPDPADYYGE